MANIKHNDPTVQSGASEAMDVEDAVRALLLVMPRVVGAIKHLQPPVELRSMELTPRHLSLLLVLLLDGAMSVSTLANRLELAPSTVSLLVNELSRKGVLDRKEDDNDRRRRIVAISANAQASVEEWLAPGADAWRNVLRRLTDNERKTVVRAMQEYELAMTKYTTSDET